MIATEVKPALEKEYQEKAQEYVTWAKEKFDTDLDPDFSDLSGAV